MSQKRINELKQELANLESLEKEKQKKKLEKAIDAIVKGMSYDEMCDVRVVLEGRIREKYAQDATDDE